MSWLTRRRTARRFDRRWRDAIRELVFQGERCEGSGQEAFWAKAKTGECPVCFRTCALDPHPDGGPGAVLVEHRRAS